MYLSGYAEIVADSGQTGRRAERQAFARVIELMAAAKSDPGDARALIKARSFATRLWGVLLDQLAQPENALPDELRAGLISIGLWVLRELDTDQTAEPDLDALIETHRIVMEGLE